MRNSFRIFGLLCLLTSIATAEDGPNILFITVDDMNCDSVGVYGCKLPGTTPHMDKLAASGLRFMHAHVQVGNCMPSRNVMWTGRYPHNNRVEGFYQITDPDYPHLADLMKQAGLFTAIRGKHTHSTPYNPYPWDVVLDIENGRRNLKNPESYYASTKQAITSSGKRSFCLQINISDPHKPFYTGPKDPHQPTKTFKPSDVPIPGFLFEHPQVRNELAHYYSSVRRADDCVGEILRALDESGERDNTVVMFLSDHGMPLPFAKTQLYYHSTHTPLIVRWPGVTKANSVDDQHVVSAIDLLPTLLDITGIKHPKGLEGRSLVPLIKGQHQANREFAFGVYNENSGGVRQPMRSVSSKRFGYIFNPWSDGKREVKGATVGTASFKAMKASTDPKVQARYKAFVYREREEFFDYENDAWFIIDSDGYAEYWGQDSSISDGGRPTGYNGNLNQTAEPWLNGRTVELLDESGNVVATTVTTSIDRNDDGVINIETERGWYVFKDVAAGDYPLRTVANGDWTQTAPIDPMQSFAGQLDEQFGFSTTARDFQNWGGLNERWFIDRNNAWYYILPNGTIFRWELGSSSSNGGLRGVLIAQVDSTYYIDLRLLTEPDLSVASVSVGNGQTTSDILFGNHKALGHLLSVRE